MDMRCPFENANGRVILQFRGEAKAWHMGVEAVVNRWMKTPVVILDADEIPIAYDKRNVDEFWETLLGKEKENVET